MKYIISERQYKIIEQSDSKFGLERFGYNPNKPETMDKAADKQRQFNKDVADVVLDKHTLLTISSIGAAFIPFIGPFLSVGIDLANAALYYKEGDTKTAGMVGVFSMIPGVGGLAAKLGLAKWSSKALGEIGKKISLGQKLTPVESKVANRVAQYSQVIQTEMKKIVQSKVGKGAKMVGTYGAAGAGYSKGYDIAQKNTPKVKASKENIDWEFVKNSFGSNGSEEENKLLNSAWDAGWRPGSVVPKQFQTKQYQQQYASESEGISELEKLIAQNKK